MSFYRNVIVAVAAMGLASAVFAADTTKDAAKQPASVIATTKTATTTTTTEDSTQVEKLNINKATAKELAKVKGVTPNKAKAIVAYRKTHGDFKSVEDLKEVKGFKRIDEKTMKDIQDHLTIG